MSTNNDFVDGYISSKNYGFDIEFRGKTYLCKITNPIFLKINIFTSDGNLFSKISGKFFSFKKSIKIEFPNPDLDDGVFIKSFFSRDGNLRVNSSEYVLRQIDRIFEFSMNGDVHFIAKEHDSLIGKKVQFSVVESAHCFHMIICYLFSVYHDVQQGNP